MRLFPLLLAVLPSTALAVPMELAFQGRLFDALGVPLDGSHDLGVALYDVQSGGTALWSESHSGQSFDNGYYAVQLGTGTALDSTAFDGAALWLGITIDSGTEVDRILLASVPYAITAGGLQAGAVVDATEVRINGTTVLDSTGLSASVDWNDITGKPAGFADDSDEDALALLGCSTDGDVPLYQSGSWTCADPNPTSIPTSMLTGTIDLSNLPMGTGTNTVAYGDHSHTVDAAAIESALSGAGYVLPTAAQSDVVAAVEQRVCEDWLGGTYDASTHGCQTTWWNPDWSYARQITVSGTGAAVATDHTLFLSLDHAALVSAGKSQADGADVRIVHYDGTNVVNVPFVAMDGWNGTTRLAFNPVAGIAASGTDAAYYVLYGNALAPAPVVDPNSIFMLWEDWADGDWTTGPVWDHTFGSWSIESGYAKLVNPAGQSAMEPGLAYSGGYTWTDYTVEMRIRDASTGGASYPGPGLRVKDANPSNTTQWWFEYNRNNTNATMRPFTNNTDHSWVYNITLPSAFPSDTWVSTRYSVAGQQIWSWYEGTLMHDGVSVSGAHQIDEGTVGLGLHTNYPTPQEVHYDDIRVWKYIAQEPSVTLGTEESG